MRNAPLIALIDMDCFYVQVELQREPRLRGLPSAVVQYNGWRGGGIIAVSYEARDKGVTRAMRGDEAKEKCPDIHLFSVPELRGKADLSRYRSAGADVIKCISTHVNLVERASVDEAYMDLSDEVDNLLIAAPDDDKLQEFWRREAQDIEGCHSVGYESYDAWLDHVWKLKETDEYHDEVRLALASYLVRKIREDIYICLGYRCSAGIAHSKVTAKYACGVHKPNQQSVVSAEHVTTLFKDASIHKIRNLGGKLGKLVQERLNIETMGQLYDFSLPQLTESFGDRTGPWLYSICRGCDDDGVLMRQLAQSIGCSKNFPGASILDSVDKVRHWVEKMSQEIVERIEADRVSNGRVPSHLSVNYRQLRSDLTSGSKKSMSGSRVVTLGKLTVEAITSATMIVLAGLNCSGQNNLLEDSWYPPLLSLGLSAGKFRPQVAKNDISRFLIDAPMINVTLPPSNSIINEDSSTLLLDEDTKDEECCTEIISKEETAKRKGFFARRLELEEMEVYDTEDLREDSRQDFSDTCSMRDFIKCEHCSKDISMWEAPEHFDWHLAKQVQKELLQEIIEEDALKRQASKEVATTACKGGKTQMNKGRILKRKAETSSSTQRTIDSFFTR